MKKEESGQIGDIQLRDYELKIDSNSYSLLEVFIGRMPFDGQDCPAVISWNYLMPVVEKIDSLMPSIKMPDDLDALKAGTHGSEEYIDVLCLPLSTPIKEAYSKVVEFIKWYNTQQNG